MLPTSARRIAALAALLLLAGAPAWPAERSDRAGLEAAVLRAVNEHRRATGRAALVPDPQLAALARGHSEEMARRGRLDHAGFRERVAKFGRDAQVSAAAENVAQLLAGDDDLAARALEHWLASRSHRRNLEGSYARCGVGAARGADGRWYLTQLFVAP